MKTFILILAFLAGMAAMHANQIPSFSLIQINTNAEEPGPGFSESAINFSDLKEILRANNCTGIRIYNVLSPQGQGSTVIIGVNSKGQELNGTFLSKKYQYFSSLEGSSANSSGINKSTATAGCTKMKDAGFASYSVLYPKEMLTEKMSTSEKNGATAFKITPAQFQSSNSMALSAVKISNGGMTEVGGNSQNIVSTEPCPPLCGPDGYYLNR